MGTLIVEYAEKYHWGRLWEAKEGVCQIEKESDKLLVFHLPVCGFPCAVKIGDVRHEFEPPPYVLWGGTSIRLYFK